MWINVGNLWGLLEHTSVCKTLWISDWLISGLFKSAWHLNYRSLSVTITLVQKLDLMLIWTDSDQKKWGLQIGGVGAILNKNTNICMAFIIHGEIRYTFGVITYNFYLFTVFPTKISSNIIHLNTNGVFPLCSK